MEIEKKEVRRIAFHLPSHLNSALTCLAERGFPRLKVLQAALNYRYTLNGSHSADYGEIGWAACCRDCAGEFYGYVSRDAFFALEKERVETGRTMTGILRDALEKYLKYEI